MPVLAIKDGIQREFSCAAWEMMDSTNSGYSLVYQDCGNESMQNGAHQVPYAYGFSEVQDIRGDKHYTHNQGTAATTWNVTHNLGKYPSVKIVDSADNEFEGDIHHINENELQIFFNSPFGGKAFIN